MQWYETDEGWQRFLCEQEFLASDYPDMEISRCDDGCVRVSGLLGPSNLSSRQMFVVGEFPSDYPHGRPRVYAPQEDFPSGTPHIYPMTDVELCVEHGDFTPTDTMSTVLGWVLQWIALYDNFLRTGERW